MIDIHCHILPNLDDGPKKMDDCLKMAVAAVDAGITDLFATPHHMNGQFENSKIVILERVNELNQYLSNEKIPLTIHPGQELRLHREIFHSIEIEEVVTLDNKGKFLLLELPSSEVPNYTHDVIYELLLKGITPIIVHPERNKRLLEDHNLLFEMVQGGALIQITSGSIIGHFGKKIKAFSEKIIEHNLAHFIATDAHNTSSRGFTLHRAYEAITKKFGINCTYYFRENAELLLSGQTVIREVPSSMVKKILGFYWL
ncbi:tyrosine-protein phosphatase [Neobacillus kokaensis]|uniref:Tyrosine-protein phosphatase n=1 Tax=Neobacillus kokaensis TaxID=2759023 RepID=A0ABQ3MYH0_9BACI|nr:CpsB/CapC family capsule biosynthesis tyrosine phosphatase [Neobacillus kokaensis]GHH97715.1 tyrosine protein phosphatase [Neobacillus kokaensis]